MTDNLDDLRQDATDALIQLLVVYQFRSQSETPVQSAAKHYIDTYAKYLLEAAKHD